MLRVTAMDENLPGGFSLDELRMLGTRKQRRYTNNPENDFAKLAAANLWRATKRGWPDFLCFNHDESEVIAVEVKPRTATGRLQYLKKDQGTTLKILSKHGIRCFVSDGAVLERFDPNKHINPKWRNET